MGIKGITLVELLIAVTIMLLFVAGGARFFENSAKNWRSNYARIEIQQQARVAMDEMTKNVRQASAATVVVYITAVPPNSKISFTVTKDSGTSNWVYYLNNGTLSRQLNNVGSEAIAGNIKELYFAKRNEATVPPDEDPRSIYIKLVLEKSGQTVTLESYTHLKNE